MSSIMEWQHAVVAAEKLTLRQAALQKLQKESQFSSTDRLTTLRILLREALRQKVTRLRRTGTREEVSSACREFVKLEGEMIQTYRSMDPRSAVETCQAIISSMRLWGNATAAKSTDKRDWPSNPAKDACVVTFLLDEAEVCTWPMNPAAALEEFEVQERTYASFQYDSSDCEKRQQRQRRLLQRLPKGSYFLDVSSGPHASRAAKSP